jgi:hypothetical protein
VLLFDIEARQVIVYDGLPCRLAKWEAHISYILRRYGLQDYKDMPHVEVTTSTDGEEVLELYFSDLSETPWLVSKDPELKQYDGINCGPIACMKVLEIYGVIPKNSVAAAPKMHRQGYCGIVMEYYNRIMSRYEPETWYNVSGATFNKIAKDMEDEEDKTDVEDGEEPTTVDIPSTPDNSDAKANLVHTLEMRNIAMEKKNKRQKERVKHAMKQCGKAAVKSGVSPGAVVTLQVDYRTYYNPEGLVAIVYAVQLKSGRIKVCYERGVITHDGSKGVYWVPADKYSINAPVGMYPPLPEKLAEVRKRCKMDFSMKKMSKDLLQQDASTSD